MAATRKAADQTLYHLSPRGFWKKFRDAVVVNPEISSGLPIQGIQRYPPPGSRPEKYSTPATKGMRRVERMYHTIIDQRVASDPAQNPYWKRDVRRAYPQLSVVTQTELSGLLIEHHEARQAVAAPPTEGEHEHKDVVAAPKESVDLTAAIATIGQAARAYSESKLPPKLPTSFQRWKPQRVEDAPHDPDSYFPMILVK
ncbi:hypothetical protein PHLCEN_2v279 [Hermanssonia centrifuga]|uniref:Uncharacterized protein n=1 Tax=Hermanssonia centrifuga TaxID=98765 RepID=A0A2R6S687_9APHY|nr:hypothetical protein PHLCEN_2v279 [Hermanssonia centrifuga]